MFGYIALIVIAVALTVLTWWMALWPVIEGADMPHCLSDTGLIIE